MPLETTRWRHFLSDMRNCRSNFRPFGAFRTRLAEYKVTTEVGLDIYDVLV